MNQQKSGYSISVLIRGGKPLAELMRRPPWHVRLWQRIRYGITYREPL